MDSGSTLNLSTEMIAEATEVFAVFDKEGKNALSPDKLGDMLNSMGFIFPRCEKVVLQTSSGLPKKILTFTLKHYVELVRRYSTSGQVTLEAFLHICAFHVASQKWKQIDDFMLTYEGQNSKGVHYYKIKGEKVPETFDKKDMSNYMKASELRHVLLNCCKGENLSEKDVDEYLNIVGVEDSTGTIDYAGALKEHSKFGVFSGWSDE